MLSPNILIFVPPPEDFRDAFCVAGDCLCTPLRGLYGIMRRKLITMHGVVISVCRIGDQFEKLLLSDIAICVAATLGTNYRDTAAARIVISSNLSAENRSCNQDGAEKRRMVGHSRLACRCVVKSLHRRPTCTQVAKRHLHYCTRQHRHDCSLHACDNATLRINGLLTGQLADSSRGLDNSRTGQLADSEFFKIMELLYYICTLNLTRTLSLTLSNIDSV